MSVDHLEEARQILTVKNTRKLLTEGPLDPGTPVLILRQYKPYSHYMPCMAVVSHVTKTGKVAVDLYRVGGQRVIVSRKAVLWRPADEVQP